MLLKIRHALLEITNQPNAKQSAVIINNEIVITSAGILQTYVRPTSPFVADDCNENVCASTKIIRKLQQCQLIDIQSIDNEESRFLLLLNFQVMFDHRKLPQTSTQYVNTGRVDYILKRYRAKLLYIFSSEEISRSFHKLSNHKGHGNGSLFVLSNILPGCEGSAVFNNKLRLIGLIVRTSFQYDQGRIDMTLVANFAYLLRDFMKQLGIKITSFTLPREPSDFAWERSLVIIEATGKQGTGTFVKVQKKKFILTCSHVVFEVNSKVQCRNMNGAFKSEVLWRNPHYGTAFDVALLSIPQNIPDRYCVRLAQTKPCLGQRVYNAGFPYFANFNLKYDFNPSIFQGRVIRFTPAVIMSDGCVQAGQSGGPMFNEHGNIMGICVSNIKVDETVYPNFNSAVPVISIRSILEDYAQTNDIRILNNLVANQDVQKLWSLANSNISKL
uniref:Peroxisomal leader peptide-processing protease n=1 Tax=Glossina austeni TaxID=7395 RepID=A0A1A9V209_GLOAU